MIRFHFLTGDVNWLDYGGKWVSKELNNGDWPYWLVIELVNMRDACGEDATYAYAVELRAVSIEAAGPEHMTRALDGYGYNWEDVIDEHMAVEVLHGHGIGAMLWQGAGNNARDLLKEARREAQISQIMFGFMMDRYQNGLGATGWDTIRGEIFPGKDGFTA